MPSSSRSASFRAVSLAVSAALVFVPSVSPAQSGAVLASFSATPSSPAPFFPADMISQPNLRQLPPIPMPQDRAADSYRIYSVLLPVGVLADPGWPRDLWLLSDTTVSIVPADQSCMTDNAGGLDMNPHVAIEAPADRQADFTELLQDFDARCHERIHLTADSFHLVVPLRLLNQAEQDEFIQSRFDPNAGAEGDALTAHYKGAPGLSRFSQVYFNAHHTVAMVYANDWCGGLCAQSYWQVVGIEDGVWKRLNWRSAIVKN